MVDVKSSAPVVQIVAGSYERILRGLTATIDLTADSTRASVHFADNFLFNAHASAIRCLALSPLPDLASADSQGVLLATGGSDERINLFSLSPSPIVESKRLPAMPSLGGGKIQEDPRNRELGSLLHHSSSVTSLQFPSRSKLLSASEDNTIAVSKTRDLSVVSTVKAPRPKVHGQATGDALMVGMGPAGINDFAVHPSMKLMLSVGRGDRCTRLWNLVTGKKAGVLNFDKQLLLSVGEGKYSAGEGRRIRWHPNGEEYVVAFEKGAIVFGADSKARSRILPHPLTKLHQIAYLVLPSAEDEGVSLLTASTEDGRLIFYRTEAQEHRDNRNTMESVEDAFQIAQLDSKSEGVSGRIKDYQFIHLPSTDTHDVAWMLVTASSDGSIRVWQIAEDALVAAARKKKTETVSPMGILIGTYETNMRITCLGAYLMQEPTENVGLSEFEGLTDSEDNLETDSQSEGD